MSKAKVYALYKGDENICDGTLQEIAEKTGKKLEYIRWLTYPTYKKRVGKSVKRMELVEITED